MPRVQLEIPRIPHNLFSPSAQIGQLFGIFLKKTRHHMSIVHGIDDAIFWKIVSMSMLPSHHQIRIRKKIDL